MKEKYWDKLAADFSTDVLEISECDVDGVILKTAKRLGGKQKRAVDFGCGPGTVTRLIAPYYKSVLGVDFSKGVLARARALTSTANVSYECANLGLAKGKRHPCDVGFCANVLISDDETLRERIAKNVVKSIHKGGTGVFIVPSFESALRVYQVIYDCQIKDGIAKAKALKEANDWIRQDVVSIPEGLVRVGDVTTKHYMADELRECLTRAGLTDIELARVCYPWAELIEDMPRGSKAALPWDWMAIGRKA